MITRLDDLFDIWRTRPINIDTKNLLWRVGQRQWNAILELVDYTDEEKEDVPMLMFGADVVIGDDPNELSLLVKGEE